MSPKDSPKNPETKSRPTFSARERCQALLTLWSRSQRPAALCRQMGIPPMMLNHWEKQALAAMLQALEPRSATPSPAPTPLVPRLSHLLERLTTPGLTRTNKLARPDGRRQDTSRPASSAPAS